MEHIDTLLYVVFNLILLACSLWMMIYGARQADRKLMTRGSMLFAALAIARYTDLFDSLIARAVVFLIVGAALFMVGNIYRSHKKEVQS
jgi:large-conductance mechanosensitive channel